MVGPAEPTVDNLIDGLTGPLPTAGDPYRRALATIEELQKRLATAEYCRDVDPAKLEPVIARLRRELSAWQKRLAAATREQHASMALPGLAGNGRDRMGNAG